MPFWTYMLHCNAGRLYTGHTDNLEHRIADHKAGRFKGFTRNWLPVELVWSQEFVTRDEAKAVERQIKGWSRAKKLALIRSDWDEISRLAKGRKKGSPSTSSGQAEILVLKSVVAAMHAAASAAHPQEACGLLLGQCEEGAAHITRFTPTANVHPSPQTHFEIDPQALIDAHRAEREGGAQVVGYFHSHPSGPAQPSATDQAMAAGDGRIWAIAGSLSEADSERDDEGDTLAQFGLHFASVESDTLQPDSDTCQPESDRLARHGVTFWQDGAEGFTPLSYSLANG